METSEGQEERLWGELAWSLEGYREERPPCGAPPIRVQVKAGLGVQYGGLVFPEELGQHNPIPTTSRLTAGCGGQLSQKEEACREQAVVLEL